MLATESREQSASVRNVKFVPLAAITNVHATVMPDSALPALTTKIFLDTSKQIAEFVVQPLHRKFIQGPQKHSARIILYNVADQYAERRKRARTRRNNHSWDMQSRSQLAGVQADRSAEGNQDELSRIVASLDRDHANCFLHGRVHHTNNARGKLFQRKFATLFLQPRGHDSAGSLQIECEVAPKKTMRMQPP